MGIERRGSRRLLEASGLATWIWVPDQRKLELDPSSAELLGHPEHDGWLRISSWDDVVHPEDRLMLEETRSVLLDGSGSKCRCEYRLLRHDGDVRWVREWAAVVSHRDHPLELAGILEDIHVEKLSEHRLQLQRMLGSSIAACGNYAEALSGALDILSGLEPFDHGAALVPAEGTGELHPMISGDAAGIVTAMFAGKRPESCVELRGCGGSPVYFTPNPFAGGTTPGCACIIPVESGGRTIAVLLFTSMRDSTVPAATRDILGSVSRWIGRALSMILNVNRLEELYLQAREDAETREELLREVNHRVKNNLAAIIGLLYAEKRFLDPEQAEVWTPVQKDLISRIEGLATVHSILSATSWAPVPLNTLSERIVNQVMKVLPAGRSFRLEVTGSPVVIKSDMAHHFGMLVNELATNTLKYAVPFRETVNILIGIREDGDMVRFTYRDDGPGFPEDVLSLDRHSLGFELIGNIVRSVLGGDMTLHNENGALVEIDFSRRRLR